MTLAGVIVLIALPITNGISRRQERRADRLALEATRNPAAFLSVLRRLGSENLVEERPSLAVEGLFCTHPLLVERIESAQVLVSELGITDEHGGSGSVAHVAPLAMVEIL